MSLSVTSRVRSAGTVVEAAGERQVGDETRRNLASDPGVGGWRGGSLAPDLYHSRFVGGYRNPTLGTALRCSALQKQHSASVTMIGV